ncbi:MAG: class I SAM-dependent methyltransferase [Rhodospirillales bacterium]|jgi:ubiquinone/menaquinone biosynthesis C-methylase UbiE
MNLNRPSRADSVQANIDVHSALAANGDYERSPHFRPENKAHVRGILRSLVEGYQGAKPLRAIDFGCGTGFVIGLMVDLVDRIDGVDITPEMMRRVDLSSGKVHLHECLAEATPFADCSFDVATAYSFMDHLHDYRDFLREAHRVLKPGGIFYADLNPNRAFIEAIEEAERRHGADLSRYPLVAREAQGALRNGQVYEQAHGIDARRLEAAEPGKTYDRGFQAEEVRATARHVGFAQVAVEYEWFLGQSKVMHEGSFAQAADMASHLRSLAPVAGHLFKYLRFVFVK